MTHDIAWGILGTARIGMQKVIPAMQKARFAKVEAIASRSLLPARAAAQTLGIPKAYGAYEDLLSDPDIEAIYIPLPNHLHVPWSIRAMEAGKHVLCEKPVALSAPEAETLIAARARTGKLIAEAFMTRHHLQWLRVRDLIASGRIGEARAVQTVFSYCLTDPDNVRNQAEMGGGGLYDIGCYALKMARFIFAAEPEALIGVFDIDPRFGTDRLTSGIGLFSGGRQLIFSCATQLVPSQKVQIFGSLGRIEVPLPFNPRPEDCCTILIDDGSSLKGGGIVAETVKACDQYALQTEAFGRAIRGEAPLVDPIEDAVANMRAIDALFRSAKRRRWECP